MTTAIDRAFTILDMLARCGQPQSFSRINEALGEVNRATLSRLLKSMTHSGHIHKDPDSGLYSLGHRMAIFAAVKTAGRAAHLISLYGGLMDEITDKFGITTILQERVGQVLINLRRVLMETSATMQAEGYVNDQPGEPWMQLLAAHDEDVRRGYEAVMDQGLLKKILRDGHVFVDEDKRIRFRRIGFPLLDEEGILIGCLGMGGSVLQISDSNREEIIHYVKSRLAEIGGTGADS